MDRSRMASSIGPIVCGLAAVAVTFAVAGWTAAAVLVGLAAFSSGAAVAGVDSRASGDWTSTPPR